MGRSITRALLVTAALATLVVGPAGAAPQIAITFPFSGSVVSRSADPTLYATGTATLADPVPAVRTYNLRRDACGSNNDNPRLSLRAGTDVDGSCGSAFAGLPSEVFGTAGTQTGETRYPAVDGLPVVLDATQKVSGTLALTADVPVGVARVEVTLYSNAGVVGRQTVEKTLQGDLTYQIPFEFNVAPSLAGMSLTSLSLGYRVRGVGAANGFMEHGGNSVVKVPVMDSGLIEVSSVATFSSTKSVYATADDTGAWEAELATPTTGARSLFARVVQKGATVAAAQTDFTVVP